MTTNSLKTTIKRILIPAFFFIFLLKANAQPLTYGDQNIGIGIGIPAITYNDYSANPSFSAMYEYGFSDKIGIGYISGGALLSFSGSSDNYNYNGNKYSDKYNYFVIGPRAAYHFAMRDITGDNFWNKCDVYGGVFTGLCFQTYKYTSPVDNASYKDSETKLSSDIFAGIRYALTNNVGIYSEVGVGVNYFTFGVSWRL